MSVVCAADIEVIHNYSKSIGQAVVRTSEAIQEFIEWMNTKQKPAQWFCQVAKEFSTGLHKYLAGKTKKHIQNVERTVWQIIETPGWVFHTTNTFRNRDENLRAALKSLEELASQKPSTVTEVDDISERMQLCVVCGRHGCLVLCVGESCLNRYHWSCSGVKSNEVGERSFFCRECKPEFIASIQSQRRAGKKKSGKEGADTSETEKKKRKRPSKGWTKTKAGGSSTSNKLHEEPDHVIALSPTHVGDSGDQGDRGGACGSAAAKSASASGRHESAAADAAVDVQNQGNPVSHTRIGGGASGHRINIHNAEDGDEPIRKISERISWLQQRLSVLDASVIGSVIPMGLVSVSKILSQIESACHTAEQVQITDGDDVDDVVAKMEDDTAPAQTSAHCELVPSWTLPFSVDESPQFNSHLMSECKAHMQHAWDSLQSRRWGLGSVEDYDKLPANWFDDKVIRRCLRAFTFISNDILFIDPYHCDSLLIHDGTASWTNSFLNHVKDAKKSKFNFVVAFVSLKGQPGLRKTGDEGYHWIVVFGDLQKLISWVYDPAASSSKTDSYPREVGILRKFMSIVRPSESFYFKRIQCEFKFQCQNVKVDGQHCGLWCVFFTMNWCLGTLPVYERLCKSQESEEHGLAKFALKLKKHLHSDIVRHHHLFDMSFFDIWQSPIIHPSLSFDTFWTFTPFHILDYCQMRYSSKFVEIDRHLEIHAMAQPAPFPPQSAFFISSGNLVIKVYRFLWGKVPVDSLAQALHEAAATTYVCQRRKKWYFEVFGVVTRGVRATYVYICVCRNMLDYANPQIINTAKNPFLKLYQKTGVAHGDGHYGNVMMKRFCKNAGSTECIDFERSFLPFSAIQADAITQSITSYYEAPSDEDRSRVLIDTIKNQGLERTRRNFRHFVRECLKGAEFRDLFQCGIKHFVKLFEDGR